MHPGDPELLMLSLPVFCQSARTHRKSERKKMVLMGSFLWRFESQFLRCLHDLKHEMLVAAAEQLMPKEDADHKRVASS